MSRGRPGGKRGPDLAWEDEDPNEDAPPSKRVPGPLFPERYIPAPKPLSENEKAEAESFIRIRDRFRRGPLYTVLNPSSLLDEKGKSKSRAGFDPFLQQDSYTHRLKRQTRTAPDLTERGGYTLKFFPVELWSVLDPKRKQKEYWDTLPEDARGRVSGKPSAKRKRDKLRYGENAEGEAFAARTERGGDESGSESDNEILSPNQRRGRNAAATRREDPVSRKSREKRGMDAEDDYPEVEQDREDGDEGGDEPVDSEFSEEDDEEADDYNAEQYFSGGENDDLGDMDDDGGGGGGGGEF